MRASTRRSTFTAIWTLGVGTIAMIWPAMTQDEQPQPCATRDVTWTAWRTDQGFAIG